MSRRFSEDHLTKNRLLCRKGQSQLVQPFEPGGAPCLLPRIDVTKPQQERPDLLALAGAIAHRCLTRGDQIAHRFMSLVRGPYLRQLTGAEQPRQLDRVPAVRLHAVAGPTRDQRRGDNRAGVTKLLYLALQPVTCRTSLVTEVQPDARLRELPDQSAHGSRIRGRVRLSAE